jgi:hypothetical protein
MRSRLGCLMVTPVRHQVTVRVGPSQRQTGAKPHCLKASHTGSGFSSAFFQQYRPKAVFVICACRDAQPLHSLLHEFCGDESVSNAVCNS